MSALQVIDKTRVPGPAAGWDYVQPETGMKIHVPAWVNFLNAIRRHRIANGLPIGIHFESEIEEYVCQHRPDLCETRPGLISLVGTFLHSAGRWAMDGFTVVTEDVWNARASTCATCEYWKGWRKFGWGRCGKCGCTSVKLFWPSEKCPLKKW